MGFYTLLASVLVGENGKVIAFEPLPRNLSYLREHLRLNQVNNVEIVEAAVSNIDGTAWFEEGETSSTGRISASGDWEVEVCSLDTLIAKGEIPVPTLIKMDIERTEFRALQGARAMLTQYHPTVFLATHGRDVHNRCCNHLTSLGYELEPITGKNIKDADEIVAFYRLSNGYNNKSK